MSPHSDMPSTIENHYPSPNHSPRTSYQNSHDYRINGLETMSNSSSSENVHTPPVRILKPGVYVPTVVFFDKITEDLDLNTISRHAIRLAKAGVAGLTTQGSNGEAVHLTHQEREIITRTTRRALDDAGYSSLPVIVGCGAQSTRETIEYCQEAMHSGGDYALVLPPCYYKSSYSGDTLMEFFHDIADASPIPILIYNYPGAVSGTDLDSDAITKMAEHPNVVGCKLTCGNTGKLNRIAAATRAATPSEIGSGFMCMGGSADFTLQTLIGGGSGIICGIGNVAPKACVRLIELYAAGRLADAKKLQAIVARGDWGAIAGGIVGTKVALEAYFGYGGFARKPLPRPTKQDLTKHVDIFRELVEVEKSM